MDYWISIRTEQELCSLTCVKQQKKIMQNKTKKPRVQNWKTETGFRDLVICLVAILALLFIVIISPVEAAYQGKYPYKAGATVGMVADIVRHVAGDKAEVTHIIGAGVDPHTFNPTRSDVAVCGKP